jgi:predicted DNA-binding transcriptional regulator YafY
MIWGEPQEVVIRFSAQQAPYIKERTWHPSQNLENLPGGRLVLRMRVADVDEVKRWLVGFGAEAEVVEPKELQQAVRQEFRRALLMR